MTTALSNHDKDVKMEELQDVQAVTRYASLKLSGTTALNAKHATAVNQQRGVAVDV